MAEYDIIIELRKAVIGGSVVDLATVANDAAFKIEQLQFNNAAHESAMIACLSEQESAIAGWLLENARKGEHELLLPDKSPKYREGWAGAVAALRKAADAIGSGEWKDDYND